MTKSNLDVLLELTYQNMQNNYDAFWVIVGLNRRGKSNLMLHILEKWLRLTNKRPSKNPEYIQKYAAITLEHWAEIFDNSIKTDEFYLPVVFDEAGQDLDSLRDNLNKAVRSAYSVIAKQRLFSLFVLTEIDMLNKYLGMQRVTALIRVTKRGHFVFWNWKRANALMRRNLHTKLFNFKLVPPLISGTFPEYKGILRPGYDLLESEKKDVGKKIKSVLIQKAQEEEKMIRKYQRTTIRNKCPSCKSHDVRWRVSLNSFLCRACGKTFNKTD